jgi:hypothetical protein
MLHWRYGLKPWEDASALMLQRNPSLSGLDVSTCVTGAVNFASCRSERTKRTLRRLRCSPKGHHQGEAKRGVDSPPPSVSE